MKLAILGDAHFGCRNDSLDFHNYFRKFYDEIFFPYLRENNIKIVFQLGDIFDRRKFINFNSLHLSRRYFFDVCKKENIDLHILLGNHDISFKNTLDINSPCLLISDYDNIKIYRDFCTVDFSSTMIDVVPWMCEENEQQIVSSVKRSKSEICFGHFEISGFEMDRGIVCQAGIDKKLLSRYDMVLSGHFHHKSRNDNIIYVGTPYEMTWADYEDIKGFHILDINTRELEFVKNPFNMFIKIFYDDVNDSSEKIMEYDFSKLKSTYVKVVVNNKKDPYLFDNFMDRIYKSDCCDVSVVEDFTEEESEEDDTVDQAQDTLTILNNFVDTSEIPLEKEKLKTIMKEIYIEALNKEVAE